MGPENGLDNRGVARRKGPASPARWSRVRALVNARRGWSGLVAGVAIGVVVALVVPALARPLFADDEGPEEGELVILSGRDDSQGGQRQRLIDQWNELHPENPAEIVELPGVADLAHSEMVARARSADSDIDIFNLDVVWTAEFAASGYIRPLDEESVDLSGFLEAPRDTCLVEGKLYCLPFNTDAGLLFYRSDIVDEPPGRWDELVELVEEILADDEVRRAHPELEAGWAGQLASYEGLTVNALEAVWEAGGEVVGDSGTVTVADGEGLGRLVAGVRPNRRPGPIILEGSLDHVEDDSIEAFRAGRVLFMRNWPRAYRDLTAPPTDGPGTSGGTPDPVEFDVTTLPGPSALGGQNLAISAQSENPRAAQELIEFLTGPRSQQILFERGGLAATQTVVYEDVVLGERYGYASALRIAIDEAKPRPQTPYYSQFSEVFRNTVHRWLQAGQAPSREDLERLEADLERALEGR